MFRPYRHIVMASIKFMACQAHTISHYKNLWTKIMNCCTNIYFNHQCLLKKVTVGLKHVATLIINKTDVFAWNFIVLIVTEVPVASIHKYILRDSVQW